MNFNWLFEKSKDEVINNNSVPIIDFETKLWKIIETNGTYSDNEYIYKCKLINFTLDYGGIYTIYINDVCVYKSYGNHDDNHSYWIDKIISPQCKARIINLVDELYDKQLNEDREKVKCGCMGL